jgi:hypothetical protein
MLAGAVSKALQRNNKLQACCYQLLLSMFVTTSSWGITNIKVCTGTHITIRSHTLVEGSDELTTKAPPVYLEHDSSRVSSISESSQSALTFCSGGNVSCLFDKPTISPAHQVGNWELFCQLTLLASRLTLFSPGDLDLLLPWYAQLLLEEQLQSCV